jgi:endonuclease/exonuclease/phosphatase family metal-dependent hydrolase
MKRLKKILRISLKTILIILIIVILAFAGFLVYSTMDDYNPPATETIKPAGAQGQRHIAYAELSFVTWNIGYCSLGKEMDFFYDGGKQMRPDPTLYNKYLNGVFNFLAKNDSLDFVMLQEVDVNAHRSYNTNQVEALQAALPSHTYAFAMNYDVDFVPMPPTNPMAGVQSGLITYSKFSPATADRYAYPLNYSWPMKLFMLDRCFIMERFRVVNGRELIVINTHNSAFADADQLRLYELWMLRGFMLAEYEKGNYVIAGGDWNQSPYDHDSLRFYSNYFRLPKVSTIPADFWPADWTWAYDPKCPTNRNVDEAYRPGLTPTSIIDFFIVSPNIKVLDTKVIPTNFEFSDHQPVYLRVQLQEDPLEICPDACAEVIRTLQDSIQKLQVRQPVKGAATNNNVVVPDRFFQRK